jgi:hypothetical protein
MKRNETNEKMERKEKRRDSHMFCQGVFLLAEGFDKDSGVHIQFAIGCHDQVDFRGNAEIKEQEKRNH